MELLSVPPQEGIRSISGLRPETPRRPTVDLVAFGNMGGIPQRIVVGTAYNLLDLWTLESNLALIEMPLAECKLECNGEPISADEADEILYSATDPKEHPVEARVYKELHKADQGRSEIPQNGTQVTSIQESQPS